MSLVSSLFRSNTFYLLALVSWLVGFSVHLVKFLKVGEAPFLNYKITQYYVSFWDYDFVRRGLVGSVFYPMFSTFENSYMASRLLVISLDLAVFLLFVHLLHQKLSRIQDQNIELLLRVILIASPLGFVQWSFDIGRYDHIAIVLVYIACSMLVKSRPLMAAIFLTFAVLTHEASALYGVSIIFVFQMWRFNSRMSPMILLELLKVLLLPSITFLLTVVFGNIEKSEQLAYLRQTFERGGWEAWERGWLEPALHLSTIQYLLNVLYILATIIVFYPVFRRKVKAWMLLIAFIPFLLLFAAGLDYPRWIHLFMMSCIILLLFLPETEVSSVIKLSKMRYGTFAKVFVIIPLGPIGITYILPYVQFFVNRILAVSF